ncbi:alpha-amylase family glycosyl hydrolase [Actinomadura kijaniata]|uniref:alpha-amylase family glycosyl hydrolase n=1 Tax=Actinomadura kijaniata TaxID=46161 RepID=UPI0008371A1E|nr:alpha-amylase family glycosyl hydrolase [Actinomadura kijaniata]
MTAGDRWWRDAVVYQVYPRSFSDGDGDGQGDLAGVRSRLPYLADLGVDAIWLNPFYPSPLADGGYDVIDYRAVDPRFGTLEDFDALVGAAADHGIRVIIDIVPNHCSSRHEWFQAALAAGPGSPERERFIFRDGKPDGSPPNNWYSMFGGPAWTQVEDGQWYLHLWDSTQPDFNWRCSDVPLYFEEVLRFWLDRGVAGIRVDVALGLFKAADLPDLLPDMPPVGPGVPYVAQPELFETFAAWRKLLDSYPADEFPGARAAVLEAWYDDPDFMAPYMAKGQLHQVFNLGFMDTPWRAGNLRQAIDRALEICGDSETRAPWVLENHDFRRLVTRLGTDQELILNPTFDYHGGKMEVDLELGGRRARAAALLLLALPGSAYVYQGQELGLNEVFDIPDDRRQDPLFANTGGVVVGRDGCRVPLPWDGGEPPFGFTAGTGDTWLPQPASWSGLTVEAQRADPGSMLELYRTAIRLRRSLPQLGDGELTWLPSDPDVLALGRGDGFVLTLNLGGGPVPLPEGETVLASGELQDGLLPPDTAAWTLLS